MKSDVLVWIYATGPFCGLVGAVVGNLGNRMLGKALATFAGTIIAMAGPAFATFYILAILEPQQAPLLYLITSLPLTIPLSLVTFCVLFFLLRRN